MPPRISFHTAQKQERPEMESKGSAAPASGGPPSTPATVADAAPGASQYLTNLPSRGFFASSVIASSLGGVRVYVCDHETSPPEEQLIKTNTTNILIRTLQNTNSKDTAVAAARDSRKKKRSPVGRLDGRSAAKRAKTDTLTDSSGQEESSIIPPVNLLQSWTVERLRAHLKARGLSPKGKKDELIARLRSKDA